MSSVLTGCGAPSVGGECRTTTGWSGGRAAVGALLAGTARGVDCQTVCSVGAQRTGAPGPISYVVIVHPPENKEKATVTHQSLCRIVPGATATTGECFLARCRGPMPAAVR